MVTSAKAHYDRPNYPSLQSIRGIAAVMVVIGHANGVFAQKSDLQAALAIVGDGAAAVALFFVLSGTVLAISLKNFSPTVSAFSAYSCRRIFRLIPLVVVTSIVGYVYSRFAGYQGTVAGMSTFFTENYRGPISLSQLAASFVGANGSPNPPLWSIFVELTGSFFLPFMVAGAKDRRRLLALLGGVLALSFGAFWVLPHFYRYISPELFLYVWPGFLFNFALGISINWWEGSFNRFVSRVLNPHPLVFLAIGFIALISVRALFAAPGRGPIINTAEATISAALIARMMHDPPRLLLRSAMVGLGDISYSVYLIHFPLLYILIGAAHAIVGPAAWQENMLITQIAIMSIEIAAALALSWVSFRRIEQPGIRIGKRLANWIKPPLRDPAQPAEGPTLPNAMPKELLLRD